MDIKCKCHFIEAWKALRALGKFLTDCGVLQTGACLRLLVLGSSAAFCSPFSLCPSARAACASLNHLSFGSYFSYSILVQGKTIIHSGRWVLISESQEGGSPPPGKRATKCRGPDLARLQKVPPKSSFLSPFLSGSLRGLSHCPGLCCSLLIREFQM